MIPVGASNNIMSTRSLNSTKARPDSSIPELYIVNPVDGNSESVEGLFNLFRVFYDDVSLDMLVTHWMEIGAEDQLLIVSDRYALAMAGYISPESYFGFVEEVADRMLAELVEGQSVPEYAVWNVVVASLR